jgi:hypothetical protein
MKKNLLRIFLGAFLVFSCLAVTDFQTQASNKNEKSSAELSDLTIKITDLSARMQNEDDFARVEIESLAAERFTKLKELAEKNPSEVLRVALPSDVLARIPNEMQFYFEKNTDTEGEIEVVYECDGETEVLKYFIKTDKEHLPVYFAKQPEREIQTGSKVKIKGIRIGDAIVADDASKSENLEVVESVLANTFGEKKVLVLLVNFQDDQRQPFTVSQVNNVVLNQSYATSVTNLYREGSYQQTWLTGDTYGWFTLPINSGDCAGTQISAKAQQAATNAGINPNSYDKVMYFFPTMPACSYGGRGTIGGRETWINGYLNTGTMAHELGHNFGLYHARALECGTVVLGTNCSSIEYGSSVDTMGQAGLIGNFHAHQKERLGWLNYNASPPITTVQTGGNYTIAPLSVLDNSPKALKIFKSSESGVNTWYYVEFRRPVGFDSFISSNTNLMNGVIITTYKETNGQENYILDMTPETASWYDPALVVNKSYMDSGAGLTITPLSVSSSGAVVNISFGAPPPQPTCVLANPTVAASPTATQWIGAGSVVNYNVTITNNNSSGCSANTFNLQNSVPNGWSVSASTGLSVAPGASAATTVQVFSPSSASAGFYAAGLGAANSANSGFTSSVSASLAVYNSLAVSVSSDKASYNNTQTVYLTANVSANSSPMSGANVTFTIKRPDGTVAISGTAVSNSSGIAVFSYKFNRKKDTPGTYPVSADANLNGVSGTSSTSFGLTK